MAHLTAQLTLDPDSEVELAAIIERSAPVLSRLVAALRNADNNNECAYSLDRTGALVKHVQDEE